MRNLVVASMALLLTLTSGCLVGWYDHDRGHHRGGDYRRDGHRDGDHRGGGDGRHDGRGHDGGRR